MRLRSVGGRDNDIRLTVPENITLSRMPPCAPELNTMDTVWEYLRGNTLSVTVWDSYTAILDACCDAWDSLMRDVEHITSITVRNSAQVRT